MAINRCRICLDQELSINIFKRIDDDVMISTKIMSLAKVHISPDDGLPGTICIRCVQKLEDCLKFVELCERTDSRLRTYLFKQCNEDKLNTSFTKVSLENEKFSFEHDNAMSPRSDSDKVLFIDESVDQIIHTSVISNHTETATTASDFMTNNNKKSYTEKIQKQQCFTCGKVMSSRFRLKTHLRTHTGEKPFTCPHCNKKFSLGQNLKVHLRVHTGEKPLQCSVCGESFAQSAGLAAHRRKHTGQTPYQCLLCPRSFRTIGHLQYHTRRHTGEKNFECDICGRAFITRSDLKQHLLTHTGERPHVCCICGLRLTRASHLKRHMQLIHAKAPSYSETFIKKVELEKPLNRQTEEETQK